MANVVNMNSLLNGKDSRWLQLEVCREFQRNKCSRQDTECKFAHPPANVEVQNGKVTACYDSIKRGSSSPVAQFFFGLSVQSPDPSMGKMFLPLLLKLLANKAQTFIAHKLIVLSY
ncbi:hypothetical protein ACLKA7_013581 [Drosophila subpalustris]